MADIQNDITKAEDTAAAAQALREDTRWKQRPGDPEREALIVEMLEKLRLAMVPIRSYIGRARYDAYSPNTEAQLSRASVRLQYERKQLKKMRR
jgi:hypothetical protein